MNKDIKIKEIYNISFDIEDIPKEDRCSMNDWYSDLLNKTFDQLDLFDVTRMIIQKIFLELGVLKAVAIVKKNPFCGQKYEGELLELLYKLDLCYVKKYKTELQEILNDALTKNETYDWLCEEERKEFYDLVNAFCEKIQTA